MYFINRSKLEEPCPFIVACYNLGDRKDHDLELAMHTASASTVYVRKQLTHFSIWTLAMPRRCRRLARLHLLAHSVYFFFCVGVLCLSAAAVASVGTKMPFVLAIYVMRVHTVLFSCIMTISFIPIQLCLCNAFPYLYWSSYMYQGGSVVVYTVLTGALLLLRPPAARRRLSAPCLCRRRWHWYARC